MGQYNRGIDYNTLALRPFPILCLIGNHDPILGMTDITETDIGIGETVYQIHDKPFVAYLKRGKAYTIDGFRVLVLGGALSEDRASRKPNKTRREFEYWTEQEKHDVFKLLENDNNFDCVISRTGPNRINKLLFEQQITNSKPFADEAARLHDEIHDRIQFRNWWCGHWHESLSYYDTETDRGYHYLYTTTNILDRTDNKMLVYDESDLISGNAGALKSRAGR